jgi:hypothetical protein
LWQQVLELEMDLITSHQLLDYYCTWERLGGRDPRSIVYEQAELDWVVARYRTVPRFAALHDAAANVLHRYGFSPRVYARLSGRDHRVLPLDTYQLILRAAACMRRAQFLVEMID